MVIDAKGKDKRGNGTAGAHVTATMTEQGTSTHVEVLTDLDITGKPAQFGRGVMEDVSNKLLGQFTDCLEQKVGDSGAAGRGPRRLPTDATAAHRARRAASRRRMSNLPRMPPREAGHATREPEDDQALDLGRATRPRRSSRRPTGSRRSACCSCSGCCGRCRCC